MARRSFHALIAALHLRVLHMAGAEGNNIMPEILRLTRNGWMPNNENLPTLVYHNVIRTRGADPAAHFEALFGKNGWPAQWRNGI